jgi:two-component system phosphate regulon sensor histidine kinase PhoR
MTTIDTQGPTTRRLAERIIAHGAAMPPRARTPASIVLSESRSIWRSRFFWKLYYGYVALILATTAAIGLVVAYQLEKNQRGVLHTRLADQAHTVRSLLTAEAAGGGNAAIDYGAYRAEIDALSRRVGMTLTVFSGEGDVVIGSRGSPALGESEDPALLRRAAADEARLGTGQTAGPDGEPTLSVVSGFANGPFVRAEIPTSVLDGQLSGLRRTVLLASISAALGALVLGFLHARQITRPLASMTAVAEAMSEGDYDQRLLVRDEDEFGTLAQALNRLASSCRDRMQTIITDRNKVVAILGSMVEGVVAIDAQERILHINRAARRLLGVGSRRVEGRPVWDVTHVQEASEILGACLKSADERMGELCLAGNPRDQYVELHAAPLLAEDGSPVGAVLVLYEVTELRHLESVRQDFVANVSHELKTPIAAIRGLVETVIDDPDMTPQYRDRFLGRIRDQADRLTTLVTELLTIARLESAEGVLERSLIDFREVVRASLQTHRTGAEEKGLTLVDDLPSRPARIEGEPEALRVAVDNLLDNAIKYTLHGGHITVSLAQHGDEVLLEVRDNGIGIEPEHLDRIFERFYRVDKARSRELGGTGLGLSIVKHIARAHAGRVWVESTAGKGSVFRIAIPASDVA